MKCEITKAKESTIKENKVTNKLKEVTFIKIYKAIIKQYRSVKKLDSKLILLLKITIWP